MTRLPIPGQDDGAWGSILNDFLSVETSSDGTLKIRTDGTFNSFVRTTGDQTITGIKAFSSSPTVPAPTNNPDAANKAYVDSVASSGAPPADSTTLGLIKLAGDLGGNANSPTVASGAITGAKIANNTITDINISGTAAIAKSKLGPLAIADGDVATGAAIAQSKLALSVTNAEVAAGAAIAQSKLALSITNTEVASGAAIAQSKLALAITDAQVSSISQSKVTGSASDASVVHIAGVETITGNKNFSGTLQHSGNAVIDSSSVGAANGVASLDGSTLVPVAQIPSLPASQITSGTFSTGQIPSLPASQITSGTFSSGQIPDLSATYLAQAGGNGPTITNPALTNGFAQINLNYTSTGTTPDSFSFYFNGVRTGYHNEKGELRARPAADNSLPLRVQQHSNTHSVNLTEWTQADNTILARIAFDGQIHAPNLDASAWQTFSYPGNAASAAGFATAGARLEPLYSVVRLRGAIQITAPGFLANATLATIPVGYRPASTFRVSSRFAGTGAAGTFVTVNTDGTITCSNALANSDNVVPLDGLMYPTT